MNRPQCIMTIDAKFNPIKHFLFEGRKQPVSYIETLSVNGGVQCDVYKFEGDTSKDLGIIRIKPGSKTPLQKVLKGDRTVEGYISGKGKFTIIKPNGKKRVFNVSKELKEPIAITVAIGELMQWEANSNSELIAYEICFPPYEDDRYKNITQSQ